MAIGESIDAKQLLEQLGRAPTAARYAALAGVVAAVVALYWLTLYGGTSKQLAVLERQVTDVETQLVEARAVASNLSSFEEQRAKLQARLEKALQKLPNSAELPVLLTDINSLGKKSGLEIHRFKPITEVDRGFYAEVPIELEFYGAYHDIGMFFDRLARLSRIVNVSELDMKFADYRGETPRLKVTGKATTFKFLDSGNGSAGGR